MFTCIIKPEGLILKIRNQRIGINHDDGLVQYWCLTNVLCIGPVQELDIVAAVQLSKTLRDYAEDCSHGRPHVRMRVGNTKVRENSGTCWQCVSQRAETDISDNFKELALKCVYSRQSTTTMTCFITKCFNLVISRNKPPPPPVQTARWFVQAYTVGQDISNASSWNLESASYKLCLLPVPINPETERNPGHITHSVFDSMMEDWVAMKANPNNCAVYRNWIGHLSLSIQSCYKIKHCTPEQATGFLSSG